MDRSPKSRPTTSLDEPGPLEVVVSIDGATAFVWVSGELDMGTESLLREGLTPYTGQYSAVVYELDSLSFMDVAGLRCLDTAPGTNTPITIRNPSRQVRRLLDLAGRESMIDHTTVTVQKSFSVVGEARERADKSPTEQALDCQPRSQPLEVETVGQRSPSAGGLSTGTGTIVAVPVDGS